MTDRLRSLARPSSTAFGVALAIAGLTLLLAPPLAAGAIALEALALAFWLWARASDSPVESLARWGWLRRPAMALWLAVALVAVLPPRITLVTPAPSLSRPAALEAPQPRDPLAAPRMLAAFAVLWAGLELLAAAPLARPYPDLTGPLGRTGPWLPSLLPVAGFLVLWRHRAVWGAAPWMHEVAAVALLAAAWLAVLRAYARRGFTASSRWLSVFDSALAALLLAQRSVQADTVLLLWIAAAGGRVMTQIAESRGALARRGPVLASLWRAASWSASACLAWPLIAGTVFAGGRPRPIETLLVAVPVFLAATLSWRRMVEAPERRVSHRPDRLAALSAAAAAGTLLLGPFALLSAWWHGFETTLPAATLAALPLLLALWPRAAGARVPAVLRGPIAAGATARETAVAVYRAVVAFERELVRALAAATRALATPLRDLHTGDAQEYLLFLAGVALLSLLVPLLR